MHAKGAYRQFVTLFAVVRLWGSALPITHAMLMMHEDGRKAQAVRIFLPR